MDNPKIEHCLYCQHLDNIELVDGVVTAYCDLPDDCECHFLFRASCVLVFGGDPDVETIMGERAMSEVESYRPANGTEGEMFKQKFCYQCKRFSYPEPPFCPILSNTMAFPKDHEEYPDEWTYDEDGRPTCTAFEEETESEQN